MHFFKHKSSSGLKVFFVVFAVILFSFCRQNSNPIVTIETEFGNINVEIYIIKAPLTSNNFLAYVDSGKYNGNATFYRTVRDDNQLDSKVKINVIQAGFFEDSLIEKYQFCTIPHETTTETGVKHENGTISMARNEPGTASTEFFICIGSQPELDFGGKRNPDGQGFAAFGRVVQGMEVVKNIHELKDSGQYIIKPLQIKRMKLKDKK